MSYDWTQGKPVGTVVFGDRQVRGCTGRQAAFINRLLDEREHDLPYDRAEVINVRHASRVIEHLLACPKKATGVPLRPATERQVAYLLSLAATRQGGADAVSKVDLKAIDFDSASRLIESLKAAPEQKVVIEVGAYRHDGTVYSVRSTVESHRLYAVYWTGTGWSVRDYNIVRWIKPEERLSLSEAKQFGAMTGMCCHCGRTLTDPKSVYAGIGPICAQRYQ